MLRYFIILCSENQAFTYYNISKECLRKSGPISCSETQTTTLLKFNGSPKQQRSFKAAIGVKRISLTNEDQISTFKLCAYVTQAEKKFFIKRLTVILLK